MELSALDGLIIGVYTIDIDIEDYKDTLVSNIILKKKEESLKMVGLNNTYLDKKLSELSLSDRSKVLLASKLKDETIIVKNLSLGLTKKEIDNYKLLLKKISKYKKIILIDKNSYLFLNLIDNIYIISNNKIVYNTNDLFDPNLKKYMDIPKMIEFNHKSSSIGININHYQDFDELLKSIYRIKS